MQKIFISHLSLVIVIVATVAPLLVSAHTPALTSALGGPIVSCGRSGVPACSRAELIHTFIHIIYFGMGVALYIIAPIAFGWGGIMFLISGGNEGRIGTAKKIMTGTAIGVVLVLSSFLIVKIFIGVLGIQGIGGFGG